MGNCFDCFGEAESHQETPDPEERRRRQEDAALKRQKENEGRGLHDPEGVKRKRQRQEAAEKKAPHEGPAGETGMKVDDLKRERGGINQQQKTAELGAFCQDLGCYKALKCQWTVG